MEIPRFSAILNKRTPHCEFMISRQSFDRWTKNKREDHEAQLKQQIYDLWLACEPQNKIAEVVNISPQRVNEIIAEKSGSTQK